MTFGSDPADLVSRHVDTSDLDSVRQRMLRMTARGAGLEEIASSKSRRRLARSKSFDCADAKMGDSVFFFLASRSQMCPEMACSGGYIGIDEARVAAKSQRQAFKFARFFSR